MWLFQYVRINHKIACCKELNMESQFPITGSSGFSLNSGCLWAFLLWHFPLRLNCWMHFNNPRSFLTVLCSNYLVLTEPLGSGYAGSDAFTLIPVSHHLQIWLPPTFRRSIRSLIKGERKTNKPELLLPFTSLDFQPALLRPRHTHLSLALVTSQALTFLWGQG